MSLRIAVTASLLAFGAIAACGHDDRAFDSSSMLLSDAGGDVTASCESTRCSRDLKSIINGCTNEVVTECTSGLGCGVDGTCVSACTSAAGAKGSVGCEFWTLPPDDIIDGSAGSCFAVLVANTWDAPATLGAELGSEMLDIAKAVYTVSLGDAGERRYDALTGPLAPGGLAIVFLSGSASSANPCPVVAAIPTDPIAHGTATTKAFHVTASVPISAYSIYPYGGAGTYFPTATLLLPSSSFSTTYLAVNGWPAAVRTGMSFLQIVANEDDTVVTLDPIASAGSAKQTWTLAKGEVAQVTQPNELTGSPIQASKPVGLFGGTRCPYVPDDYGTCDILAQQIPSLDAWGNEYALVPYRPRTEKDGALGLTPENVPWRFVGAADGTVLTYDPAPPPGAPTTLAANESVTFMTTQMVSVKSQDAAHPFFVAEFMTGQDYTPIVGAQAIGDPDYVVDVPSDQFLDRYIFFTDYTYSDTTLTVVRRKTEQGFSPVTLECAGDLPDFMPLGTAGEYEYTWVRLTKNYTPQMFAKGECGYGRHEVTSDGPFGIYVWGTDDAASYGYAGGMGLRSLNQIKPKNPT